MTELNTAARPSFVERDPDGVLRQLIADYEALTGRTLYPAQTERLQISQLAYRESLLREAIQDTGEQNLLAFARGIMLDYLGDWIGCGRLPSAAARTYFRLTFLAALPTPFFIPVGTMFGSSDGSQVFATLQEMIVPTGAEYVDVEAEATTPGAAANDWAAGGINVLLSDLDGIAEVANLTSPTGGAEEEDDEHYRSRIRLAPSAFSNAGGEEAYIYHAKSAHQSIIDVAVDSPLPGDVHLYPLTDTGLPDAAMLARVYEQCNARKVRPLTDRVQIFAPERIGWILQANVWVFRWADLPSVEKAIQAAAEAYVASQRAELGIDIVPSRIGAVLHVPGVYRVELVSPSALVPVSPIQWAICDSVAYTIAGVVNG